MHILWETALFCDGNIYLWQTLYHLSYSNHTSWNTHYRLIFSIRPRIKGFYQGIYTPPLIHQPLPQCPLLSHPGPPLPLEGSWFCYQLRQEHFIGNYVIFLTQDNCIWNVTTAEFIFPVRTFDNRQCLETMGLLPDTENCGLCMRRECRERFLRHRGLAIPTCITACAWRTCRVACRDR